MKRDEFLKKLYWRLRPLCGKKYTEEIIDDYYEMFEASGAEGRGEETLCAGFGGPGKAARALLREYLSRPEHWVRLAAASWAILLTLSEGGFSAMFGCLGLFSALARETVLLEYVAFTPEEAGMRDCIELVCLVLLGLFAMAVFGMALSPHPGNFLERTALCALRGHGQRLGGPISCVQRRADGAGAGLCQRGLCRRRHENPVAQPFMGRSGDVSP